MFQFFLTIIGMSCLLYTSFPKKVDAILQNHNYNLAEVMKAYGEGSFRIIPTSSINFKMSSTNAYINTSFDGVYRVSDGKHYRPFSKAEFSPDGIYIAQAEKGVYRLDDERLILSTKASLEFSDNSEYVAVGGDGVYRLSDNQKVLATHSSEIVFSPNNLLVATLDGIFRLSDNQQLLYTSGFLPTFSPDSEYAWTYIDGLYRLGNQQKIIDILSPFSVTFSPNMKYVVILGDGVYRLDTGEQVFSMSDDTVELAYVFPEYSPCSEHISINGVGVYRLDDGKKLFDTSDVKFGPYCTYVAVGSDGVYRLRDMQKLFDINTYVGNSSTFSADENYIAIPGDGIYRIADGQQILDRSENSSHMIFSPRQTYAAFDWDGVYRLSDGQKIFTIDAQVRNFTSDESHLIAGFVEDSSIYDVNSGDSYPGLQPINISAGIMAVGNTVVVIDETLKNQRYRFGRVVDKITTLLSQPGYGQDEWIYINAGISLAILAEDNGWYQIGYDGKAGWVPVESLAEFYIPNN